MTSTRRARRAFSLLELVVVIGIIVVLAALVLGIATAVVGQSERREAANTMALLDAAIEEYQTAIGRPITFGTNVPSGPNAQSYDVSEALADQDIVVATLFLLDGNDTARTILSRIDQSYLRLVPNTTDGSKEVRDPWDRRFMVVFPGRTWKVPADGTRDPDGSVRTTRENVYGICTNRKTLLVSAGPDGQFGDLSGNDQQRALAEDNVYLYEPEKP